MQVAEGTPRDVVAREQSGEGPACWYPGRVRSHEARAVGLFAVPGGSRRGSIVAAERQGEAGGGKADPGSKIITPRALGGSLRVVSRQLAEPSILARQRAATHPMGEALTV
jgi:hypothetical protein